MKDKEPPKKKRGRPRKDDLVKAKNPVGGEYLNLPLPLPYVFPCDVSFPLNVSSAPKL